MMKERLRMKKPIPERLKNVGWNVSSSFGNLEIYDRGNERIVYCTRSKRILGLYNIIRMPKPADMRTIYKKKFIDKISQFM